MSEGMRRGDSRAEFGVLGPVEARIAGREVALGHARQRSVLAVLLADAGRVVSVEQVVGRVWGDDPPRSALNILSGYVTRLRQAFAAVGAGGIPVRRGPGGYLVEADLEMVDMHLFRHLVATARAAESDGQAAGLIGRALGLWRGPAFAGLPSPWLRRLGDALDGERWNARLDAAEIGLRQGRHRELAGQLSAWAAEQPLDERLAGQLMLATYRQGQQVLAATLFAHVAAALGVHVPAWLGEDGWGGGCRVGGGRSARPVS
jgi:DNA-binding SARP family transcriptional activator